MSRGAEGERPVEPMYQWKSETYHHEERRWVSVQEFADYLGISVDHAYRMIASDPTLKRVTRRLGRRVLVCIWAWKQGVESKMAGDAA